VKVLGEDPERANRWWPSRMAYAGVGRRARATGPDSDELPDQSRTSRTAHALRLGTNRSCLAAPEGAYAGRRTVANQVSPCEAAQDDSNRADSGSWTLGIGL
jgi:hypothetical protein